MIESYFLSCNVHLSELIIEVTTNFTKNLDIKKTHYIVDHMMTMTIYNFTDASIFSFHIPALTL